MSFSHSAAETKYTADHDDANYAPNCTCAASPETPIQVADERVNFNFILQPFS